MPHAGIQILLVEDNPNDVKLALYAFESSKIVNEVHIVRDGREALEYIFCSDRYADRAIDHPPKVILLDLKLPYVDGLEVLRQIKTDPRTQAIPVVIMTASREDRDISEAYRLGANSYIVKPVEFENFAEVTRQLGYYWLLVNQPSLPSSPALDDPPS
ncbi:response regulator [bacterium]|nr:response regulator [bacterium]